MTTDFEAKARELRASMQDIGWGPIDAVDPHDGSRQRQFDAMIAAALREAASVPDGCVRLSDGRVVRLEMRGWDPGDPRTEVEYPLFADGVLWFQNDDYYTIIDGKVWEFFSYQEGISYTSSGWVVRWGDGEIELAKCYSTREAAEAARTKPT